MAADPRSCCDVGGATYRLPFSRLVRALPAPSTALAGRPAAAPVPLLPVPADVPLLESGAFYRAEGSATATAATAAAAAVGRAGEEGEEGAGAAAALDRLALP